MARLTTQQRLELELGLRRDVDGDTSPTDVSPPPSVLSPINGNASMTSHGVKKAAPPPTAPKPASRSPGVSPGVSPSQYRKAEVGIQGYRPVTFNPSSSLTNFPAPSATPFIAPSAAAASATTASTSSSFLTPAPPAPATAATAASLESTASIDLPLPPPPPPSELAPLTNAADANPSFRLNGDDFPPPPPENDELFPAPPSFPPPPPPIEADHSSIPSSTVNPPYVNTSSKNYNNANSSMNNNNGVINNNNNNNVNKTGYATSKLRQYQPPTFHGKLQDEKSIPLASILTKSLRHNEEPSSTSLTATTTTTPTPALTPTPAPASTPASTPTPAAATNKKSIPTVSTPSATMSKQEKNPNAFSKNYNNNNNNNITAAPTTNNVTNNANVYPYKNNNSVNNVNTINHINNNANNAANANTPSRLTQPINPTNEYSSSVASDKQRRKPSTPNEVFIPKVNPTEISGGFPPSTSATNGLSGSNGTNGLSGTNGISGTNGPSGQNPVMRNVKPPISPASSQRSSGSNPSDFTHEAEVDKLTDQLLKGLRATKDPNFFGMCAKCGGEVLGESTGCQAMDNIFHVKCFTCSVCSSQLKGKPFYAMEGKPFCEDCYLNTLEKCSVCSKPITDRILRATGKPYHPACFICVVCGKSLDGIPFTVDATNQIHCIEDFHNKFAPKCHVCGQGIVPEPGETETVRIVALDRSFHVGCYKCEDCGLLLGTVDGEQRPNYPLDGHILCQQCNGNRIRQITSPKTTDL